MVLLRNTGNLPRRRGYPLSKSCDAALATQGSLPRRRKYPPPAGFTCIELAIDPQQGPPSSQHYCVAAAGKQQAAAAADGQQTFAG